MPTKILLKRGLNANIAAAKLDLAEPAFVTDKGKLYIGTGNGTEKVLINPIDKPAGLDTATAYTRYQVNEYGQVISQSTLLPSDIPQLPSSQITGLGTAAALNVGTTAGSVPQLDITGKLPLSTVPLNIPVSSITGLGTAATLTAGNAAGNVPVLDSSGKLAASTLPSIAITDVFTVASQVEMLALTAETGDIAIRSDLNQTFILKTTPATTIGNWVLLATPTDVVTSVNGRLGAVTLSATDMLMTTYNKPSNYSAIAPTDTSLTAIGKLERNFDNYAPLLSPEFTGTPTSTTPAVSDNSTRIATTKHVKDVLLSYAPLVSPQFTGTPTTPNVAVGDSSTLIANTAYVQSALAIIDGGSF